MRFHSVLKHLRYKVGLLQLELRRGSLPNRCSTRQEVVHRVHLLLLLKLLVQVGVSTTTTSTAIVILRRAIVSVCTHHEQVLDID